MSRINKYDRELTPAEIGAGVHRSMVGGMWDQLGRLQLEFLRSRGLEPSHRLLDIGCGALRGGLFFIGYLEPGNYYGLDSNRSLLEAAERELGLAGLTNREPHLVLNDCFEFGLFKVQFDFLLAQSVFTHLFANHIVRCLVEARRVLAPAGRFFATFFLATQSAHLTPVVHQPGGVTTHYDRDPFHYSAEEIGAMARLAGLSMKLIGEWQHPRAQQMVQFSK